MRVTLTVSTDCGDYESVNYIYYYCYGNNGLSVRAAPNPAQDYTSISIINDEDESFYSFTDPNGVRIRINDAYTGTLVADTWIYANGESVNVSNIQNGVYSIEATASDFTTPLTSMLVISR